MSPGWPYNIEEMPMYTPEFSLSPSMPTVRTDSPVEEVPTPKKKVTKRRQSKKVVQNDDVKMVYSMDNRRRNCIDGDNEDEEEKEEVKEVQRPTEQRRQRQNQRNLQYLAIRTCWLG
uniref:Uncharacterized protein n=1 Tax=Tanacetum cinerariifolium TaxID=118510 RepID=A0A699KZF9_TANCI|nr:hypothetical protein [Tanacetum cinerariifolium]